MMIEKVEGSREQKKGKLNIGIWETCKVEFW